MYFMMKLYGILVLVFGNFLKFWESISHDYQSTIVGKKKIGKRDWIQIVEDLDFPDNKFGIYSIDSGKSVKVYKISLYFSSEKLEWYTF